MPIEERRRRKPAAMSEWTTACPATSEDDRRLGHLLLPTRLEGQSEAEDLGVMAHQLGAILGDRVDGARALRLLRETVQHGDDALLVRHADAGSQVVAAADGRDGLGKYGGRVDRLVDGIDVGGGGCPLQSLGQ
jgi:hypothetical protein